MVDADAISIQPLHSASPPEIFEGAFNVLCDVFVASSAVHVALDTQMDPYRRYYRPYFEAMVAENLSLVALTGKNANDSEPAALEVAGVIMGTDFAVPDDAHAEVPPWIAPLYALLDELTDAYREEQAAAPGEIVLVDMAAVPPQFGGRGIYKKLRAAFHDHALAAGYQKVLAELSSAATQKVCVDRFGHTVVNEIAFADFKFNGAAPFLSIKKPSTIQLVEGSLV